MEIFCSNSCSMNLGGEGKIFTGPDDEALQCIDWQ